MSILEDDILLGGDSEAGGPTLGGTPVLDADAVNMLIAKEKAGKHLV